MFIICAATTGRPSTWWPATRCPKGIYGRVNWIAIGVFLSTILLEVPFMNTSLYAGPIATALQGVDLAWAVGLVFPALSYYWLMNKRTALQGVTAKV